MFGGSTGVLCQSGGLFLSPFDDEDVIEGQASVGVEIEDQLGGVPDHIILPVGGGGLSSGLISYFGTTCTYTFVEPNGGACLRAAIKAGRPVKLDKVDTFADGAAVGQIGTKNLCPSQGCWFGQYADHS